MPDAIVIVSIDTEEDDWHRRRSGATVENIAELRTLAKLFARLGVRPTYFTTHQVAVHPRAAGTLRDLCADGRGEIGAHLHPWNTPPLDEPFVPRNSMLKNLPAALQRLKLERLTAALEESFGFRPRVFRAGRFGLGPETVGALLACGYEVDSSVSPLVSFAAMDDGPDFRAAPLEPYRLTPDRDVTEPAPGGGVLEIPLSCGFSREPFALLASTRRVLEERPWRWLHLAGLASRAGLVRRVALSPEESSVRDMLTLSRRLLARGVRHLQLTWHSPSLKAGLSPFGATPTDVARLYAAIEAYLEGLSRIAAVTFATVGEAAAVLGPAIETPQEARAC